MIFCPADLADFFDHGSTRIYTDILSHADLADLADFLDEHALGDDRRRFHSAAEKEYLCKSVKSVRDLKTKN